MSLFETLRMRRQLRAYAHLSVRERSIHLILTRFQPGGPSCLLMFEPFQRFSDSGTVGKPLKRFWEMRQRLITRLKPGENEMKTLKGIWEFRYRSGFCNEGTA